MTHHVSLKLLLYLVKYSSLIVDVCIHPISCCTSRHTLSGRITRTSKRRLINNYQRLTRDGTMYYGGAVSTDPSNDLAARIWKDIAKTMYSRPRGGGGSVFTSMARYPYFFAGAGRGGLACPAVFPEGVRDALFRLVTCYPGLVRRMHLRYKRVTCNTVFMAHGCRRTGWEGHASILAFL